MVSTKAGVGLVLLAVSVSSVGAQTRASTEDGKPVILYPDGTWRHATSGTPQVRDFVHVKPEASKQLYETRRGNYQVWYDGVKWKPRKPPQENVEAVFVHGQGEAWVMVISERLSIPLSTLRSAAIANAANAAPDVRVTLEERRQVNGIEVLCCRWMAPSRASRSGTTATTTRPTPAPFR
jgi:hypothetical protein